jgi:hypothetical protein
VLGYGTVADDNPDYPADEDRNKTLVVQSIEQLAIFVDDTTDTTSKIFFVGVLTVFETHSCLRIVRLAI